jgi:hypothetical protein
MQPQLQGRPASHQVDEADLLAVGDRVREELPSGETSRVSAKEARDLFGQRQRLATCLVNSSTNCVALNHPTRTLSPALRTTFSERRPMHRPDVREPTDAESDAQEAVGDRVAPSHHDARVSPTNVATHSRPKSVRTASPRQLSARSSAPVPPPTRPPISTALSVSPSR